MLDIGWSEMLLIAVVAILVIGPKDLPKTMRMVGQWVGRARRVAREFKDSVDDMVRESELEELRRETENMSRFAIEEPKPVSPPRVEPTTAPEPEPEPASAAAQPAARPAVDT
jgi:sec-independent protein translocase protein TatB